MHCGSRTLAVVIAVAVALPVASSAPPSASSEIQLQFGDLLYADARYGEALEAYQLAKRTDDRALLMRARMGAVRSALRVAEFEVARADALALKHAMPGDAEAVALYGDSMWALGLFDESEQAFRDALAIDADLPRGHHGLARALAARRRLDTALGEAQAALRLAPRDPEFHHTVGAIYERMHRFEEAAIAFGNYVNLLPHKDRSDKAAWSRAAIRFLRSFGARVPFQIEEASGPGPYIVDFRLVKDKIVFKARVNGGAPMDFVLDTGAEQTVLSRRTAQRMGVAPIVYTLSAGVGEIGLRGLQVGRLDSLAIGALTVRNVPCLIKNPPLGGLPTREGESFSPLAMGLSTTIDYQRRQLTIGASPPPDPTDVVLPLRVHRLATVRGIIGPDRPVTFVVDTGGEVISISAATASALERRPGQRHIPLKVYGTSGWDREAYLLPGVDLTFEAIHFRNFPVVVLNLRAPSALLGFQVGGIVGHKFLSKYRVGLDLDASVLRLQKL